MSIIDIIISVVVLLGVYRGFMAGMIKTAFSLISWLVALVSASKLAKSVQVFFIGFHDSPVLQLAMSFVFVFLVVLLILQLVIWAFQKAFSALKLDIINKLAGGLLGGAVGLLKILVVLSIASPLLMRFEMWERSPLAQGLLPLAPVAKTLMYKMANQTADFVQDDLQIKP